MRRIHLMIYYCFGLIVAADSHIIYTSPYTITTDQKNKPNFELDFYGFFATNSKKSKFNPIKVIKTDTHLEIISFSTLGDINITICNEQGNFVHCINTVTGNKYLIDMCNWCKGRYTIRCISPTSKEFIYSYFDVED